jgi:hypothetical protein
MKGTLDDAKLHIILEAEGDSRDEIRLKLES